MYLIKFKNRINETFLEGYKILTEEKMKALKDDARAYFSKNDIYVFKYDGINTTEFSSMADYLSAFDISHIDIVAEGILSSTLGNKYGIFPEIEVSNV